MHVFVWTLGDILAAALVAVILIAACLAGIDKWWRSRRRRLKKW